MAEPSTDKRLVLRIERDGELLGSWTIGDAPLDMSVVDEQDGRVLARFQASSEDLRVQEPVAGASAAPPGERPAGPVDELPHPAGLFRTAGDDFTMPLPEPTAPGAEGTASGAHRPVGGPRPLNLAAAARIEAPGVAGAEADEDDGELEPIDESLLDDDAMGSLTGELVPLEEELFPVAEEPLFPQQETEPGAAGSAVLDGLAEPLTTSAVRPLTEEQALPTGAFRPLTEEVPLDAGLADEVTRSDEVTVRERFPTAETTAPGARETTDGRPTDPGPTDPGARPAAGVRNLAEGGTDPEHTARSVVRPTVAPSRPAPPPAEVWAQKQGEWTSIGHLAPGQRVRTLGGWVRLAPDGRLVVSSGRELAGTATLIDGRMVEIEAGQEFVALPPGASVMLAVGDKGIYVRSEPVALDDAEAEKHAAR